MRFEWDSAKAAANIKRHRVSFDEAVTVFYDPLTATLIPITPRTRIVLSLWVIRRDGDFLSCAMLSEAP